MITKISAKLVDAFCKASIIEDHDKELYMYGTYILLSKMFYFFVALIVGILLGVTLESIVFFVMFNLLRSYAGGVHAKKEFLCNIVTIISLLISIILIKIFLNLKLIIIPISLLAISIVSIMLFSPLETEEKPLTHDDKKLFKRITCIIVTIDILIIILALAMHMNGIVYSCIISLLLASVLLLIGKFRKERRKIK